MEFHEGSFKIASKTGCAIVPMAIYNSAAIFEDHLPKAKKATVILEYCKPIYMKDLEKEDQKHIGAYTRSIIEKTYFQMKEEAGF
jgi:1-acyl-sn-glycerol-3-phosphate acyltransferase